MSAGIRFLVATDVHLGHREKHPVRQHDSFEGFQQVIHNAKQQQVDFLLLGGDLFDEVNPSKECFFRCLNILKSNVFGNRQVGLHVSLNGSEYRSNLQDPDLHIALPIFTIHGNHDYPTNQFGKISACDLLQASNYVNYFGKHLNLQHINIRPLIITKNSSPVKIALYGLGYIKDQILNKLFEEQKVTFEKPQGNIQDYVCIFVFHQNRYKKGFKAGTPIHKSFNPRNIPQWMNLVIWGHQHEAIYKLEYEFDRPVFQPGSTVLTSYIESESIKKQCLLINVPPSKQYELTSILLERSYRPMRCLAFQYQLLRAEHGEDFDLFSFLEAQVEAALRELANEKRPIIRIKIECTGLTESVKARHVETRFADRVANGEKILLFWRRKTEHKPKMEDQEVLSRIKNKQPINNYVGIVEELDSTLKKQFQRSTLKTLPKEELFEVISYLGKTDNVNASDIIRKRCGQLERNRYKPTEVQLNNFIREKETQFKRSIKYHLDRKQLIMKGAFDRSLYPGISSKEEFLALQQTFATEAKYALQCKFIEEKLQETQQNNNLNPSKTHSNNSSNSNSNSIMSRPKKEESSVEIVERSDSEDCCSRAEKTKFDETGNKMRYYEAQEKLKQANIAKSKRSAIASTKQEMKSENKVIKNVRFSDDFM